ncbi:MAG: NAD(+) synthase [Roseburia sp.]|nr:NAD(+) synthase [Roseburia sp.]MCM1277970.1 NAD(+) synthase [Robinsoniella sp.]
MQHGFIKVAAASPKVKVADTDYNRKQICRCLEEAEGNGAKIIVFPELCITGYTCGDLFLQETLLNGAKQALEQIVEFSDGLDALVFVGMPLEMGNQLYNVAAVINCGELLAFIPKTHIPGYGEFYETRHFAKGNAQPVPLTFDGVEIPFGTNILFETDALEGMVVAAEICEDVWVANPPSTSHALAGANVIVNLSASNENVGKDEYRQMLIKSASARLISAYIFTSGGAGESTQDVVFGAHNIIAENGTMLAEENPFKEHILYADIDIHRLKMERRRMNTFGSFSDAAGELAGYLTIPFAIVKEETKLTRSFLQTPFVPVEKEKKEKRCEQILSIQSFGLVKRYEHTGSKCAVIGISGGLDSTLALLVTVRAFDLLGMDRKNIYAVTMPCFGTTDRTYENACRLAKVLGVTLREVDIKEAVTIHFRDIGQDIEKHDITYENGQARERTQVLMDIANQVGGLVIGTGDMSELALGWATYNGDHMSMYGVNAGVPKTLVRHLVGYYGETCGEPELKEILQDVLDTPVSPELLPPKEGQISQKTEDLVGPYELHDFFLYYMLRCGYSPSKVYRIALTAFESLYTEETILKWLKTFYHRFFTQQFKRSCLPDGPKVGSVAVSPRGDLRMPSDASYAIWKKELDAL